MKKLKLFIAMALIGMLFSFTGNSENSKISKISSITDIPYVLQKILDYSNAGILVYLTQDEARELRGFGDCSIPNEPIKPNFGQLTPSEQREATDIILRKYSSEDSN